MPDQTFIFSNKYISNKSFVIHKLQYPKYSLVYQTTLHKYNFKSFRFEIHIVVVVVAVVVVVTVVILSLFSVITI